MYVIAIKRWIGEVTQESIYIYDADGNQLTKSDPDNGIQSNIYDGDQMVVDSHGYNVTKYNYEVITAYIRGIRPVATQIYDVVKDETED